MYIYIYIIYIYIIYIYIYIYDPKEYMLDIYYAPCFAC